MTMSSSSDQVLRSVLGAIDCGVVVLDRKGNILESNPKALQVLGLSHDQFHSRGAYDPRWGVVGSDGEPLPASEQPSAISMRTGKRVAGVVMGVDRPGPGPDETERVWLQITATPLHDESSVLQRVVVTFVDITQQRAVEQALREEHAFHKELMGTVLAGITVTSPEGQITYANPQAEALLGLQRSQLAGLPYDAPQFRITDFDGGELPIEELPFAQIRRSRAPVWDVRHAVETPTGVRRLITVNGAPLFREDNSLRGAVFAFHDITAAEAARRELHLSEQRLRMATWAADLAQVDWIIEGALQIDGAWLRRRGWGADRPVPSTVHGWRQALAPGELARINAARDEHFAGAVPSIDVEFELPISPRVTARLIARVVERDASGRPRRVAGMLADVSAERRAREERKALQAQMLESAAYEATARVTGGMANDFNNLLVGILGAAHRVRELTGADHPAREELDVVESTAQRAAELSRELLAMSGHGRFRLEPVDLGQLAREMREALISGMRHASRIRLRTERELPHIEGDTGQLRRMIYHLVANAVDAHRGEAGTIELQIRGARLGPRDRAWLGGGPAATCSGVCIEVKDDGEGIDPARVSELVLPFSTTRDGRRGLGLAAVQGIVRGHRGFLALEGIPGEGTQVTIFLPNTTAASPASPPPELDEEPPPSQGAKLLVVDDEPVVLRICEHALVAAGYTVHTATQGAEGLERWREHGPYDLVVSDLSMPVMDGEALVRALRADNPALPILVMSGYSRSEVVGRMVGAGSVEFLAKPFKPRRVVRLVSRLLARAQVDSPRRS
jgi:PAS domain S-box-containing protein